MIMVAVLALVALAVPGTPLVPGSPSIASAPVGSPRPVDPNQNCQGGGPNVADLPPAQRRLAASSVWGITTGSRVIIGLVGSGVDPSNPQLRARVAPGTDLLVPGATGNGDCVGHGTALAGMMVASARNGIGLIGVAPGAVVLPERVTGDGLNTTPDLVARGIDAAVTGGARVVLVTLPVPVASDELDAAIERAERAEVVVVAPADPLPEGFPGFTFPADPCLKTTRVSLDNRAATYKPTS